MVLSQFAHYLSTVLKFLNDTTDDHWHGVPVTRLGTGWVIGGGSEELGFCRAGSAGELMALRFLRLRATSVNSSSWLTDVMVRYKNKM